MAKLKPLLLIILDGFGIAREKQGNPVMQAATPSLNELEQYFPFTTLQASGVAVGLPWAEAGNSEVGHLTIGSGRILYHHLPRIIYSIYDGSFFENAAFKKAIAHMKANNARLHVAGLTSSGSVHSYIDHLYALFELAEHEGITKIFLHAFTDGKDAPPKEGAMFLRLLEERARKEWPHVKLVSVVGRFFAMDRDTQWERIRAAYELLVDGRGHAVASIPEYLETSYAHGITDEFIEPAVILDKNRMPEGCIQDNDAMIFFNFREDSMREIARAFALPAFAEFPRKSFLNFKIVTMTEYEENLPAVTPAFPRIEIRWPLARVLGEAGLSHLHIAETEKYAHVTYFFNGGREDPLPGEERILIPSVSTPHFELTPEMRAPEITEKILASMPQYDVIIANYANADMVGHSGNFDAAIKAVEVLDGELKKLMAAVLAGEGAMIITADHGNIELKRHPISGEKLTEHSINPVPMYLVGKQFKRSVPRNKDELSHQQSLVGGILTDVAPTILDLLELKIPEEMTGKSLLPTLLK